MASVKICGIRTPEALNTARKCGAAYAGFVFYPPSPRALNLEQARDVIGQAGAGIKHVALLVDPDDRILDGVARLSLDMIQLHGNESPARVMEIRSHTDLPVMKSIPIARPEDTAAIAMYEQVADWILCDAKAQGGQIFRAVTGEPLIGLFLKIINLRGHGCSRAAFIRVTCVKRWRYSRPMRWMSQVGSSHLLALKTLPKSVILSRLLKADPVTA